VGGFEVGEIVLNSGRREFERIGEVAEGGVGVGPQDPDNASFDQVAEDRDGFSRVLGAGRVGHFGHTPIVAQSRARRQQSTPISRLHSLNTAIQFWHASRLAGFAVEIVGCEWRVPRNSYRQVREIAHNDGARHSSRENFLHWRYLLSSYPQ